MGQAGASHSSPEHPARGGHRAVHRRTLRSLPAGPGVGEITPGYRIWLHVDGVRMFGPGTHALLRHVAETGSLHRAAKLIGMSYTKAWHLLRETEEHLGFPLVERRVGGQAGGGTSLTPRGSDLLERFERFLELSGAALQEAFDDAFDAWQTGTGEPS